MRPAAHRLAVVPSWGWLLPALAVAVASCSYKASPANGKQQCAATGGKRCPDGYFCAGDNKCWQNGTGPTDGGPTTSDGGPDRIGDVGGTSDAATDTGSDVGGTKDLGTDTGTDAGNADAPSDRFEPHDALPAPSGHAVVPGGITSSSATYRMVKTTAQSPGGNLVRQSAAYRMVGGLIGGTQK